MKTKLIIIIFSVLTYSITSFGQCGDGPTSLGLVNISISGNSSNADIIATANSAIPFTSGLFGGLWIRTVNSSNVSISGTSATGLAFAQEVLSEDLGLPAGFKYTFFSSAQVINPSTLLPNGTNVTIGNINISPSSSTVEVVMMDLLSPDPNGGLYLYYRTALQVCNANGFEDNLINTAPNVALPIDIKTFSATKDGDRNARLDWSTSLEINSAYFGIERSTDGKSWEVLDRVIAAGNSNTEQFYEYVDRDLPLKRSKDQIFYYRLQLVDLDGRYKYSDIRGVNFGKENTNKVISLYPNPAVQMVNLDLSGMDLETGAIYLRVTDMQGRNMIDKTILGNGIEPIEVTQLPAGTYNVAVSQGTTLHQKQFIKID